MDRDDLSLLIDKIYVYVDRIDVHLKAATDALLNLDEKEGIVNFNGDTVKQVHPYLEDKKSER